jgi:hypothetical protein
MDRRMMDTVGDVVTELLKFDQNLPIIKSKDEEGNGFDGIWCIQKEVFLKDQAGKWDSPLHPSDIAAGEYGEDPDVVTKVVIWG